MTVKSRPSIEHVFRSLPLIWLSLAFMSGLLLANRQNWPLWVWGALILASLLLAGVEKRFSGKFWLTWRRFCILPLGLVLATIFCGALRYQMARPVEGAGNLAWYATGKAVQVEGVVQAAPQIADNRVTLRLSVEKMWVIAEAEDKTDEILNPSGMLLVTTFPENTIYRYGDRLRVQGELTALSQLKADGFRQYLYRQGVQAQMAFANVNLLQRDQGNPIIRVADGLRSLAQSCIYGLFPQPEAALLAGILVGNDDDLPVDVQKAFQDSGTAHIIAISGFNMAIIATLITLLLGRLLPAGKSLPLAVAVITFYTLLTGASPSVVRAAIMSVMGFGGVIIGRRQLGINSLLFTAALMSLFDPFLPWDISFQLSFAATLGLVWYAGPLQEQLLDWMEKWLPVTWAQQTAVWVGELVLCTLAAQLTTLPVMIYHFQRLSLAALLANIVVLPVQSLLMILGGLSVLAGLLLPPLGQLLAYPAGVLLTYTIRCVMLLANLPGGVLFSGDLPLWSIALIYILLFLCSPGILSYLKPVRDLIKPTAVLIALALGAVIGMRYALSLPDGNLHLTLLGGEDQLTVLLRTPGGQTILINGATINGDLSGAVSARLSPFERHLDAWIITDASPGTMQEVYLLNQRFLPGQVYRTESVVDSALLRRRLDDLAANGATGRILRSSERLDLGEQAEFEIVESSKNGTVLRLRWRNLSLLIPGGVSPDEIDPEKQQQGEILLLSRADLVDETSMKKWAGFHPQAVFAASRDALPQNWVNINTHGWVEIRSDGRLVWVETGR
ncbi:MAG: ComEC family competence protein [Anaerolineae bacterium]|nr:ComEC family competence protein [Anaerolineae bacterium]